MSRRKALRRAGSVFLAIFILVPGLHAPVFSQNKTSGGQTDSVEKQGFNLTIDNIMRGSELTGYEPRAVRWSQDNQRIYFQWKQTSDPRDKDFDNYAVNRDGSGLRKLTEEEAKNAPPLFGELSKDKRFTLFTSDGDIFLYDHAQQKRRAVTRTADIESNARFTRDGRRITFTRANNLFALSLDTGWLEQITDIRSGGVAGPSARGPQRGTESQEYLKKEERELIDAVKRRAQRREEEEERRKRENPRKAFNLSGRQAVANLQLSPDETYIIAAINEPADSSKNTIVPNYVTESAYTEDIGSRTKVGDAQSRARLAIIDAQTGDVKWVDHGQKQAGEKTNPEDAEQQSAQPAQRAVQLFQPVWSEDGAKAVLMARSADNKDRWIMALDVATGKTRIIFSDHDDAWIGGPGGFTLGWLGDNQRVYFQSERDGYSHLYAVAYEGGDPRQLTSGKWEVTTVRLAEDKKRFYITTSEVHPGERHLYSMSIDGGERAKLTSSAGNNQSFLSPDEKWVALIHSYSNRPPELYVQENRANAQATKITASPAPEFFNYPWIDPPIVTFKARDGAMVPARLYKPKNFRRGGPAVLFVHGAGYLQNVHRWWSSYFREYMFHHLLMERGFVVMDVDYRASAGYGRDWRTAIYRHMGGRDLDDQVDAARWLVSEHGVDSRRIGIYGGSYGGFITLMAMFTQPDVFAAGAALRPVTDWAHYNHGYTSNILNVPQSDREAYKRSSPIYFAEGLKGALLICHGMVDTNVHFQDTVRLAQRLIELRKENWEVAIYPVENHGFVEPTSWADEYKRILNLFEANLKKGLPAAK
ncbi:MAG: prolyl oligopeptidase family serine peptidase [Acidobacteriota bacterium]